MLTAEQKTHWDVFGFLMLPQLFTPEEVRTVREASIEVIEREKGAAALRGEEGWSIGAFLERDPGLTSLLDDDRFYGIPETLLGPDFILEMTDGHVRAGDTPWHGGAGVLKTARVCFYFDKLNKDDGCLRVIPGSHRKPFSDLLQPLGDQKEGPASRPFGVSGPEVPCVALESEPGDVLVFTESVFHASFGGKSRLQLTAQFCANPTSEEQLAEVQQQHENQKWGYHPAEAFINSDRSRIRRMVSKLVEWRFTPLRV